ncbi:MFS transporter [Arthrobacter agilis]|uniref:MFS transporter n=1 Tax=Arthrobacter agilis TaxID=37921 RepID=UPI000B353FF3|nr:MFS transporter [Arthrobacter agilis]OUM43572.1 MFS transporter [Arthrobacter agilis]PPB47646.1 MFS transporter [Arthrobacter agilis]TPV24819.1 MFS transporter [Arthrobacter agilis]VDR30962.1 Proline porter II [Arthrobacter agilis]
MASAENTPEDGTYTVPQTETPEGRKTIRKAIGASAVGNATEWFDYGVYAVVVGYITANFFPGGDEGSGTIWALATFAVSFLVRPLGGFVWGPLGDRLGRRKVLALTIMLMAGATFCIGLLPTFSQIGYWAPALLVFLRLVQGFSTGGEYGGAATFMAEYSPDRKRGFFGSFLEFGTIFGFALGTAITLFLQLILGEQTMNEWGWRLPFLIAGPMGLIGLYLRSKLEDTPVFREFEDDAEAQGAGSKLKDLVSQYWRPMLAMAGLVIALNVANYTLLSYMPTYLETRIGLSADGSLTLILVGQLVMMCLIPFAGRLSDRVGRKPMWWTSMGGLFVAAIPMYLLMGTGFVGALIGFAVLGVLYVLQLATISATFPAMFPTQVRFAGFAITYNLATAVFGGTAPLVNDALIAATGNLLVPAFYMMAACLVGMAALPFARETAGESIRGTDLPGEPTAAERATSR